MTSRGRSRPTPVVDLHLRVINHAQHTMKKALMQNQRLFVIKMLALLRPQESIFTPLLPTVCSYYISIWHFLRQL